MKAITTALYTVALVANLFWSSPARATDRVTELVSTPEFQSLVAREKALGNNVLAVVDSGMRYRCPCFDYEVRFDGKGEPAKHVKTVVMQLTYTADLGAGGPIVMIPQSVVKETWSQEDIEATQQAVAWFHRNSPPVLLEYGRIPTIFEKTTEPDGTVVRGVFIGKSSRTNHHYGVEVRYKNGAFVSAKSLP